MVGVGSGIAIQLHVWVGVSSDAVNVGVSQDKSWLPALEQPVLNLPIGSCYMIIGSVNGPAGGCSVLGRLKRSWGGAGRGRGSSYCSLEGFEG